MEDKFCENGRLDFMENLQEAVVPKMLCAKYLQPNTLQLAQGFIQFL